MTDAEPGRVPLNKDVARQMLYSSSVLANVGVRAGERPGFDSPSSRSKQENTESSKTGTASDKQCLHQRGQACAATRALLLAMCGKPALVPVVTGLHPTRGGAPVEHAGGVLTRLPEVIDAQAATGHDQLEPALRIGEDSNILQWISLDDEQICIGSRRHHAHLPLHPQ